MLSSAAKAVDSSTKNANAQSAPSAGPSSDAAVESCSTSFVSNGSTWYYAAHTYTRSNGAPVPMDELAAVRPLAHIAASRVADDQIFEPPGAEWMMVPGVLNGVPLVPQVFVRDGAVLVNCGVDQSLWFDKVMFTPAHRCR